MVYLKRIRNVLEVSVATIKDIAKKVGLSVTTVSRALNGYDDVSEKTRKKIQLAAAELKYSPNVAARSLVTNRTQTIGLLVSGLNQEGAKDHFMFDILNGLNHKASNAGYDLVLFSTDSAKQRVKSYTQLCRERRVDGVILQGIRLDDPYLQEIIESDIPCVVIDIPVRSSKVGHVTTDNRQGAKKAVDYLLQHGHKQIAFMNGHGQAHVSQERLLGYQDALQEAALTVTQALIYNGEFSEYKAEVEALKLFKAKPEATAVFCASDLMALGVMKAAKRMRLRVPEDVSIIGFDNITLAEYVNPGLTTISQEPFQMGIEACAILLSLLTGEETSKQSILPTTLIERESVAFVRS
nr:LacI family DNA-binding transcriptional regulator [Shouchella xiaoxiensis]